VPGNLATELLLCCLAAVGRRIDPHLAFEAGLLWVGSSNRYRAATVGLVLEGRAFALDFVVRRRA